MSASDNLNFAFREGYRGTKENSLSQRNSAFNTAEDLPPKDNYGIGRPNVHVHGEANPDRSAAVTKVIETIFLGPGEVCCNAMGVSQENNRDLVRMLINSFVWMGIGGLFIAVAV